MDNHRRQAISLFIDNYHDLRKYLFFKAPSKYLRLSSLILSLKGIRINTEEFQRGLTYIKQHTPLYSPFRSLVVPASAFVTIPGKSFDTAFNRLAFCRNALKAAGFRPSSRLVPAAMALFAASAEGSERLMAARAFPVLESMKVWPSTRSIGELFAPAVLVASSEMPGKEIINHAETLSRHLDIQEANPTHGLHFLAQILAYDDGTLEAAAKRCATIYATLKKMKFRSPALCFGTIGFLALSGHDCEQALLDAMDTMSLLKLGKCFSGLEKEQAMLVASALVAANHFEPSEAVDPWAPNQSIISAQAAACLL